MSCEICHRVDCSRCFHSLRAQELFDLEQAAKQFGTILEWIDTPRDKDEEP